MATVTTPPTSQSEGSTVREVRVRSGYESTAWRWMRYSALLLIPLVWIHVILQDVIVGVHAMDIDYVAMRWASLGWRIYDILLLGFAFAHGMNGLRQIVLEYFHTDRARAIFSWVIFFAWLVITAIGAVAIIAGVRAPA